MAAAARSTHARTSVVVIGAGVVVDDEADVVKLAIVVFVGAVDAGSAVVAASVGIAVVVVVVLSVNSTADNCSPLMLKCTLPALVWVTNVAAARASRKCTVTKKLPHCTSMLAMWCAFVPLLTIPCLIAAATAARSSWPLQSPYSTNSTAEGTSVSVVTVVVVGVVGVVVVVVADVAVTEVCVMLVSVLVVSVTVLVVSVAVVSVAVASVAVVAVSGLVVPVGVVVVIVVVVSVAVVSVAVVSVTVVAVSVVTVPVVAVLLVVWVAVVVDVRVLVMEVRVVVVELTWLGAVFGLYDGNVTLLTDTAVLDVASKVVRVVGAVFGMYGGNVGGPLYGVTDAAVVTLVVVRRKEPEWVYTCRCSVDVDVVGVVGHSSSPGWPSVFGRNLQCELVRKVDTREECHWSHAYKSFKRAGVETNGILECKFLSKNAHRAIGWADACPAVYLRLCDERVVPVGSWLAGSSALVLLLDAINVEWVVDGSGSGSGGGGGSSLLLQVAERDRTSHNTVVVQPDGS
jgi:hypothetical protein